MLKKLSLKSYKGFNNFTVVLGSSVLLMGPNNAGKSTIINAIRLCGAAGRVSMRVRAVTPFRDRERWIRGFPLSMVGDDGFDFGNIRHEFADVESRLDLEWTSGATIHVVWPVDTEPFFWLDFDGAEVTQAARAKVILTRAGLVPTLTPVERYEKKLGATHLTKNVETKLSSRHFRNNLQAEKEKSPEGYSELIEFLLENTPELTTIDIKETYDDGAATLDLFYRDPASHMLKEIYWAGDGLQIWLQILFHLWRTRDEKTVILDEPDVFLHPDLQRRLVRVIESSGRQSILSSHAAEIAAEVSLSSLTWIDRTRRNSRKISDDSMLEQFSSGLGGAFNLSIARALRAKTALFVEGKDMKILRVLARRVGAAKFASEVGIAVIPIGGYSNWPSVQAFGWIKSQFLGSQVKVRLLVDSDYRRREEADRLIADMANSEVVAHVWGRKELESYLLEVPAISRVSRLSISATTALLDEVLSAMRVGVQSQFIATRLTQKAPGESVPTAVAKATAEFERLWEITGNPIRMSPAKDVISSWNSKVVAQGGKIVTAVKLASTLTIAEIDPEMVHFLSDVEVDLS